MPGTPDVTKILAQLSDGDGDAIGMLLPIVYDELRLLANRHLRGERGDHTLQATALVHEAYLRLVSQKDVEWQNRAHFFAVAAQAIRRILVDHARKHRSEKRGGGRARMPIEAALNIGTGEDAGLVALDEALGRLAVRQPRKAQVVEMRYFGGLKVEEVAAVLGITARTVTEDWRYARAWLYRELAENHRG